MNNNNKVWTKRRNQDGSESEREKAAAGPSRSYDEICKIRMEYDIFRWHGKKIYSSTVY